MSKKKVTAPLTYDPGKGRPKEYLAYLNWQEMQELQRINGGNMERGPGGLPSFPPKGAMSGNSARSPAATSKSKGAGSKSTGGGMKSDPGATGGGKTPARASSYGRTVESSRGNGGTKTSAQKAGMNARDAQFKQVAESTRASSALKKSPAAGSDLTKGGIKTLNVGPMGTPVNVKTGQTSGQIKGAISRVAQTPVKSPMAGQGTSFGSALDARIDTFQRINDARLRTKNVFEGTTPRAPQGVFGPRVPAGTGYLRTATMPGMITTGMTSPYAGVAPPRFNAEQTLRAYEAEKRASVKDQSRLPTGSPTLPSLSRPAYEGATPSGYTGYGSVRPSLPSISRQPYDMRAPSAYSGYGAVPSPVTAQRIAMDPSIAGRLAEAEANYKMVTAPGLGGAVSRVYADPDVPRAPTLGERISGGISDLGTAIYNQLGFGTPASTIPGETVMSERVPSDILPTTGQVPPGESELRMTTPGAIRVGDAPPYAGAEKVLSVENLPSEPRPGYTRVANIFATNPRTLTEDLRQRVTEGYEGFRPGRENTAAGVPGPETPATDYVDDGAVTRSLEPEDVYGPKFVSPEIQKLMEDQDKRNRRGVRIGKTFTGPIGRAAAAADALRKVFTGKTTTEATADLKRAYMQASPSQKAELEKKYPNLTKFAMDAGLEPQLPVSNYTSWAQRSGLTVPDSRSGGADPVMSGGIADITSTAGTGAASPATPTTASTSGSRPYIYYEWDLGINVPSPGEPKYTEYQKYLKERADAQKALGLV